MKILFVGPQGAGKSTQAKLLSEYLKVPSISTGDIFRAVALEDSVEGQRIKEIMGVGQLVDDLTTSKIVEERLKLPEYKKGFIFDGYPRSIDQIKYFDPGFDKVFYLKLSDYEAKQRLLRRGRADDNPELIDQRLKLYHDLTDPILGYYEKLGILEEIDATLSIESIQELIRQAYEAS